MDTETMSRAELLGLFDHADERTRLLAGLELSFREDNPVAELAALLGDSRPRVRATAAYTLGKLADQAAGIEHDDDRLDDGEFRDRLAAIPTTLPAIRVLYTGDLDAEVRYQAFAALGLFGALDVPTVTVALDDRDPRIRATAPFILRRLDPSSAAAARGFAAILLAAEQADSNAWQESAFMLEQMGPAARTALPALATRLGDPGIDPDLRASLLAAVRAIES